MHLIEVERKRELGDSRGLRERLFALGFQESEQFTETDIYYSRPDVDYLETVECLRVRQRDSFAEITYKPPSDSVTHRAGGVIAKQETNVVLGGVEQAAAANRLLCAVGMVELVRVVKNRVTYRHPGREEVVVSIDAVDGAGTFVETEITAADSRSAATRLAVLERELGIGGLGVVEVPYRDLVMAGR
ncbi:class IV adenylate cyclase [Nocardia takedensis]|uniref:class IV adenylate cyclase n=1 Tax=Nocardia takedensis TaxID=259390 RepID=UPI00030F80BF|nr:class IV adenylate cyclase [Nocardia takedensis]